MQISDNCDAPHCFLASHAISVVFNMYIQDRGDDSFALNHFFIINHKIYTLKCPSFKRICNKIENEMLSNSRSSARLNCCVLLAFSFLGWMTKTLTLLTSASIMAVTLPLHKQALQCPWQNMTSQWSRRKETAASNRNLKTAMLVS